MAGFKIPHQRPEGEISVPRAPVANLMKTQAGSARSPAIDPIIQGRGAESPQLAHLNRLYLTAPSHTLEGFRMDAQETGCLMAVEEWFEVDGGNAKTIVSRGRNAE
jgi:hypothetical protein